MGQTLLAKYNTRLTNIRETVERLQNGQMKKCPKSKQVKRLQDFPDNSLITGYGRLCSECKKLTQSYNRIVIQKESRTIFQTDKTCPRCGAKMLLREGCYGKFYGYSRFPYCRGTRKI
ncbi:topoisomerase DNA-binding C4 zinc finger domain-containing protein [Candidatus Aerophobetes bacterium]|nr:topoisomerase DNA-binding C4 zinc finger domain-containing protein [Candidatus Aerophobetes bacterium]